MAMLVVLSCCFPTWAFSLLRISGVRHGTVLQPVLFMNHAHVLSAITGKTDKQTHQHNSSQNVHLDPLMVQLSQ